MKQKIIYRQENGVLALVIAAPDCRLSIDEIARKDVPAGVPYLIVDDDAIPDLAYSDAWEADFSNPDGFGIGPEAWFSEQAAREGTPS
jgi:hypothetical protein